MPKKTKAQKLRAQQRQGSGVRQVGAGGATATFQTGPRMSWGRYLGLRFLLHAAPVEDNHAGDEHADEPPAAFTDVALLCIDELRDGIIRVFLSVCRRRNSTGACAKPLFPGCRPTSFRRRG